MTQPNPVDVSLAVTESLRLPVTADELAQATQQRGLYAVLCTHLDLIERLLDAGLRYPQIVERLQNAGVEVSRKRLATYVSRARATRQHNKGQRKRKRAGASADSVEPKHSRTRTQAHSATTPRPETPPRPSPAVEMARRIASNIPSPASSHYDDDDDFPLRTPTDPKDI